MKWFANLKWQRCRWIGRRSLAAGVLGLSMAVLPAVDGLTGRVAAQEKTDAIEGKEVLSPVQRDYYKRKQAATVANVNLAKAIQERDEVQERFEKVRDVLNRPRKEDETPTEYANWQKQQTRKVNDLDRDLAEKRGAAAMAGYKRKLAQRKVEEFERQHPNVEEGLPQWAKDRLEREANPSRQDNSGTGKQGDGIQLGKDSALKQAQRAKDELKKGDTGVYDGGRPQDSSSAEKQDRDRTHDPLPMNRQDEAQQERILQHRRDLERHEQAVAAYSSQMQSLQAEITAWQNDTADLKSEDARYAQDVKRHNQAVAAYERDVKAFNAEDARYEQAVGTFNREVQAYEREVQYFNSLPPHKRTKIQYDRLVRWKANLDRRGRPLDAWKARLDAGETPLRNRKAYLDSRVRQLDSWNRRLDQRDAELMSRGDSLQRRHGDMVAKGVALGQQAKELEARGRQFVQR